MGERGSRKNRFFLWIRNLKRQRKEKETLKKEQKQKEQEEQKKRKKVYSKPEVIAKTILGLFLGLVESILLPKKKEQQEFRKLEDKLKQLDQDTIVLQLEIKKEVEKKIEKKSDNAKQKEVVKKQQEKQKQQETSLQLVKQEIDKIEKKKKQNQNYIKEIKKKVTSVEGKQKQNKTLLEQQENKINEFNKKPKEVEVTKKKTVGIDLETEKIIMLAALLEKEFYQIKNQSSMDTLDGTIQKIDILETKLLPYQKESKISKLLKEVKEYKSNCFSKREQIKKNVNHNQQELITKTDLMKQELILKIKQQQQLMEKMNQQVISLPVQKKKRGIFRTFGKMITSTLITGFGLSRFFKKKISAFDIFLGAICTNYGIRGMRNLGKGKESQVSYFEVEKIVEQLSNEQKALEISTNVYEDSIEQLKQLQQEFQTEYGMYSYPEVKKLQVQFITLETDLKKKLELLYQKQKEMHQVMEKGKVKKLK